MVFSMIYYISVMILKYSECLQALSYTRVTHQFLFTKTSKITTGYKIVQSYLIYNIDDSFEVCA